MTKKYFFFDIDGTLTDRQTNQIVPSAQVALDNLQANGHFVAIATGRAHYKASPFMQQVGLRNMVCSGGGGLVLDQQLIQNKPLELAKAKAVIRQAETLGYGVLVMRDDSLRVWGNNDLFRQQVGERQEATEYVIDPQLDFQSLPVIYKIYVAIPAATEAQLTLKVTLGHLRFVPEYLMFQYDDKYRGIVEMMQRLNAPLKDVVVFGDGLNDMDMFRSQWTSIAMGNGAAELKAKADYVTTANVADGIYQACVHFGWL
ncbi:HAD-IIB family hydrolase [Loigolactobacillus jiayinensis]|uniref:HAD-IIB family hydrolase n=1 Tax=Loigolactobacillus jiayinensis TaxID=2486016 RepID=A0ABW1RI66_9LACO|nr:HAD family hydrolase [Loigolactobacillus jiayinensis]